MKAEDFKRTNYSGYQLVNRSQALQELASLGFPPDYGKVMLEHITYQYPDREPAPEVRDAKIVGHLSKDGVQCVVCELDGTTHRPTGGTFHITYSLDAGHKPAESNALISELLGPTGVLTDEFKISPIRLVLKEF